MGKTLIELSREWAGDTVWTGTHDGINFDAPSPTHSDETVGQTICRLGCDYYREAAQPGTTSGPNPATFAEAKDLLQAIPGAKTWVNTAMTAGFDLKLKQEDPFQVLMEAIDAMDDGPAASHPVGDVNPRYANLVGDLVGDAGQAQMGRVTSTAYRDE